ncbi:hypothetical protein M2152_002360 [Microbacteriaceae bacterium SG_E_30_P1]|uniref:Uncharacterized protein n=1 Tax=Antiquaquibacter oligotrophicus TaxID=2880260 RepID=A0ABT6KQC0_9MICO|nr:hypothetical protein [Antiquaquibacter oligotrophicus]MDH6182178.1 hypothetical protein [Antiquaquibacter oligotrophicus]UDF12160.1 hypothetical protein LH407_08270 [Antiquaquibacter oligotrophicus]
MLIGFTGTLSVGSFVLGLVLGEPLIITGAALLLLAAMSLANNPWRRSR